VAEGRQLFFRLLGTRVRVSAPVAALVPYRAVFGSFFQVPAGAEPPDLSFSIEDTGGEVRLRLEQDGRRERHRLSTAQRAFGFVYARILDEITRRDPDLLCIHAAGLSRSGSGLAIAAQSRHGKSTLALALASRGYALLSDEVAPVRRSTLALEPFPLAIGCRTGTYTLLRDTPFARHGFERHPFAGKMLYDPLRVTGRPPAAAPIRVVFFLESESQSGRRRHRLYLDPPGLDLAREVAAIPGVTAAAAGGDGETLEIEVESGAWAAPQVEELLRRRGVLATRVEDLGSPAPDFDAEPRLVRLPTSAGVLGMLRHLRGFGAVQDLALATPGGFGPLVLELAATFREVAFYRLTPGRLQAMVRAIESVRLAA